MLSTGQNKIIIDYLSLYDPVKIGIFGSYARGDNKPGSDLDVLIELKFPISLMQLVRFEQELSDLLGVKVDLVPQGAIKNEKLRHYIETDLQLIYQA